MWGAASSLKALDRLIDLTIDYTRERHAFGKPILDNQVVHFRLAELRTEVEALRALTWSAIEHYVAGNDVTRLASMAKLKTGRLCREVADACLQYWGGMGYHRRQPGQPRLPRRRASVRSAAAPTRSCSASSPSWKVRCRAGPAENQPASTIAPRDDISHSLIVATK